MDKLKLVELFEEIRHLEANDISKIMNFLEQRGTSFDTISALYLGGLSLADMVNLPFIRSVFPKHDFDYYIKLLIRSTIASWYSKPDLNSSHQLCDCCGFYNVEGWNATTVKIKNVRGMMNKNVKHICTRCYRTLGQCNVCQEYLTTGHTDPWEYGFVKNLANLVDVDGQWTCHDCIDGELETCHFCGCHMLQRDVKTIMRQDVEIPVCHYCADEMVHCSDCGEFLVNGFDEVHWDGDEPYCHRCINQLIEVERYDYYDQRPKFLLAESEKQEPDTLFFGYELEIEHDWRRLQLSERKVAELASRFIPNGWGYYKHDGSMKRGIEMAAYPMTWMWYRQHRKDITKMLEGVATQFKVDQWDTENERYNCGLHVHMSKAAFNSSHLYKFVKFFYKLNMRPFVEAIAGRGENKYARYHPLDAKMTTKMAKDKNNPQGKRYAVLNMVGGHFHEKRDVDSPTIEFRLFKGTLDPVEFHSRFDFLMSIYEFTRDESITMINKNKYLAYLANNRNRFACLLQILKNNLGLEV